MKMTTMNGISIPHSTSHEPLVILKPAGLLLEKLCNAELKLLAKDEAAQEQSKYKALDSDDSVKLKLDILLQPAKQGL